MRIIIEIDTGRKRPSTVAIRDRLQDLAFRMEAKTMPASDAERNSVELAAQMHDLSIHLWNALEREYQPSEPQYHWTTCDLREEIESMQGLLKNLSAVRLAHSTTEEG